MKKILFVITKSNWGGAQRYVFDLATSLPKSEYDVAVAFGQPGLLAVKLKEAGIKTYNINSMQRDVALGGDVRSFFELLSLFKKERPDVVHLNSSKAGGLGSLAGRLAGLPAIVFTAHGWPFREQRTIVVRGALWLASWLTALLSTRVICVSDYDLHIAQRMPFVKHKLVRIYNGIAPLELGSGEKIRSAFPPRVRIVGTIGELNKNKNQQSLIEQAKSTPEMYVAIVGEGEERTNLEHLIKKYNVETRVKLFGFMPASEVLKGFDVFALPSIKEGLPYVLLEAKMAGLPIVASKVGGISEILEAPTMEEFTLEKMVSKTIVLYN